MPVVLQGLDPRVLAALRKIQEQAQARGIQTNLLSAYRTKQDQQELYDNWQAGQRGLPLPHSDRGAVPLAALPGTSPHEKGFAFDLQAVDPSRQSELWNLGPAAGVRALGIRDPAHFEFADAQGAGGLVSTPSNPPPSGGAGPSSAITGLNASARGMRNNNPGNLESNSWTQGLPGYKGSDGRFAIFDTVEHGMGALDQNLASYGRKGINTPFGVASTWAPASDNNNPNSYGARLAKELGVGLNDKIDLNDPGVRAKIARGIASVENGPGDASIAAARGGGGSASAAASPASGDWQNLLGAEAPQDPGDLGSLLSSAVSTPAPSSPRQPQAPVQAQPTQPPVDFSFAPIADTSEALGARYVQNKKARELSTLGDLFTIKTIGQPGGPKTPAQLAPGSSNRIIG